MIHQSSQGICGDDHADEGGLSRRRQYSIAVSSGRDLWPGVRASLKVYLYTFLKKSGFEISFWRKPAITDCCLGIVSPLGKGRERASQLFVYLVHIQWAGDESETYWIFFHPPTKPSRVSSPIVGAESSVRIARTTTSSSLTPRSPRYRMVPSTPITSTSWLSGSKYWSALLPKRELNGSIYLDICQTIRLVMMMLWSESELMNLERT